MFKITELKEVKTLRTYATEPELPEAIKLLVGKALVEEILPHIIQIQYSDEFVYADVYEIILFGD